MNPDCKVCGVSERLNSTGLCRRCLDQREKARESCWLEHRCDICGATWTDVERLRALLARCVGETSADEQERMEVLHG